MTLNDCFSCRYTICQLSYTDYLPKNQVVYCRPQILWMLKHSPILDDGRWPIATSGYIDTHEDIQTSIPQVAPFQSSDDIWAEVLVRLDAAGQDGVTLREELDGGCEQPVSSAAWRALGYVGCGRNRRLESYRSWKSRKYGSEKPTNVGIKNK